MATATTTNVTFDTVRTDVQDLRKGDIIVYRTARSVLGAAPKPPRIYMVEKVGQEDTLGKVRITLRKQGEGRPLVFTTSGVSRFEKIV